MDRPDLTAEQLERYARQIVLDGFGAEAQGRLRSTDALVVGMGGLGSPVVMYLTGAGIGGLGLADDDVVERSNLQRQPLHGEVDIGRPKVESAAEWVENTNPDVDIEPIHGRVDIDNIEGLLDRYDLVIDCTDRIETRFLINDACTLAGLPFVHGAVYRFEGQVTTFTPGEIGPCYRCLFPEAPPPEAIPDCATAGVLGPIPGVIGGLEAIEAIKLATGIGDPAVGRLLVLDALRLGVDELEIRQNPDCPVCGDDPRISSIHETSYEGRCALPAP